MLTDKKRKHIIFSILVFAIISVAKVYGVDPTALINKQIENAEDAFSQGDLETAYKRINAALQLCNDETSVAVRSNAIVFAKQIYSAKLQVIAKDYDAIALSDIKIMLDKYPDIVNTNITKKLAEIELAHQERTEAAKIQEQKRQFEAQQKLVEEQEINAQKRHLEEQENIKAQTDANKELAESFEKQAKQLEEANKNTIEQTKVLQESLVQNNENQKILQESIISSTKQTAKSTRVMIASIIGIALLILLIVMIIVLIIRKNMKQQELRQEQYLQAFKVIAENQNQTNRIMLGGVTDIYGSSSNGGLKLAGSSSWAPAQALPVETFTQEDLEELKQLAIKCEELGSKIDQITSRKNNSKNVSELVYKLSMQLGLSQGQAMVNFCAAMTYDAGFLGLDPSIWDAESLSEEQKAQLKEHVSIAEKYLDFVPKKYWQVFDDASKKHHENIDGSGYPNNLKDEEIPQIARLIRVAETYVSMSSRRNYRQTMDKETAIQKLMEEPEFYDSTVVSVLDKIV